VSIDTNQVIRMLPQAEATAAYRDLHRQLAAADLFETAIGYYLRMCALSYCLLAIGIVLVLALPANPLGVLVAAVMLGIALVQIALIGHDAGHLAVFRTSSWNHALGLVCWSLTAGVGYWYWRDRHNRHHAHTNDVEADPDLGWTVLIAYEESQAAARRGWLRAITPYQAFIAAAFVPLMALAFRVESWVYALGHLRGSRRVVEVTLLSANLLLWTWAVRELGSPGLSLFLLTQVVASGYLSFIIAPNHKGMPVWAAGVQLSFVERQVFSSRNLTSHPAWDLVFGGLNYQIEHHLFPRMARVHFRRAAAIVAPFCRTHGLPYEVASPPYAFGDIFIRAHRVGQVARRPVGRSDSHRLRGEGND
jgi:fatty acid desaturase